MSTPKPAEDNFLQSARAFVASTPPRQTPSDDRYYFSYDKFDSALSDSVRELDIPSAPEDGFATGANTMTPAALAKYSRYFKDHPMMEMATPMSSPVKPGQAGMASTPVNMSLDMFRPPSTPSSQHHQMPALASPYYLSSPERPLVRTAAHNQFLQPTPPLSSLECGYSSDLYSDDSPDLQGHNDDGKTFSGPSWTEDYMTSVDMRPTDSNASSINWQPVLMAPQDNQSEEIIRTQQSSGKLSNRKSCLPPGKVDSYMAGPSPEGLFECLYPGCNKLFRRRYNVRSHIQTHLCDRPYACDSCDASFVRPHDLRRHERCHKEDRPFTCPCGKSFTRHDALQRHRLRMICTGGIEIPGRPRKAPGRRGRPPKHQARDAPSGSALLLAPTSDQSDSSLSPESSPEAEAEAYLHNDELWS